MFNYFFEGGAGWMGMLTIVLIGLLLAAWKAPAWVKEIGLMAVVVGVLSFLVGTYQVGTLIQATGDVALGVIMGGVRVLMIAPIYAYLIYLVSLIIRIIQKPRLL